MAAAAPAGGGSYIDTNSQTMGKQMDTQLTTGTDAAITAAKKGTLEGVYEAQGIMTKTTVIIGAMASTVSSMNQGFQGAANKG